MSKRSDLVLQAPCKVNLTLDVFPPRPDGFHDLDSVVAKFAPWDILAVTALPDRRTSQALETPAPSSVTLECDDPTLPTDGDNLVLKAVHAYVAARRLEKGDGIAFRVRLAKRLPHQAGLGGGSSDAAAMLRALDNFYGFAPLGHGTGQYLPPYVFDAAARIGSDVSLFLHDGPVRMRGRGEIIEPLGAPLPPLYGVLVKPSVGVPTAPAYRLLDALPERRAGEATVRLLAVLDAGNATPEDIGAAMGNDFEAAVLPAFPEVAEAHRAVTEAGAVRALLCGSGSCIFGLARDRDHALALTDALAGRFPWVRLAEPFTAAPIPEAVDA